jgi:hypothetical protein
MFRELTDTPLPTLDSPCSACAHLLVSATRPVTCRSYAPASTMHGPTHSRLALPSVLATASGAIAVPGVAAGFRITL